MKKLPLLLLLLIWSIASSAITHTVTRGESLQSIAAQYHISEAQLVEANPGVDRLFYVGLKLNIPETTTPSTENQSFSFTGDFTNPTPDSETPSADLSEQTNTGEDNDNPGAECSGMIEYGFLPKEKGVSGTNYTYAFTVGANYFFMHRAAGLFAGARIGYNSATFYNYSISRYSHLTVARESHFITLPINVGYAFATDNRNLAFIPYAGIDFNFCVAGKIKAKGTGQLSGIDGEQNYKKKVGLDARVGIQLRIFGFNVGASYVLALNDHQEYYFGDDGYIAINLAFGF